MTDDSWMDEHLPKDLSPEKRKVLIRLLKLRQALGTSSVSKFNAFLKRLQPDHRIRSLLMMNGAGTGRWTAKGPQLQNLPSRNLILEAEEVPAAIEAAINGTAHWFFDDTIAAAKACIRGCLITPPGSKFYCADFSAIEGRVLAWLAQEYAILDAYRAGKRMYCVAAAGVYNVPYDYIYEGRKTDPSCKKMDAVGKVIELACGYQGALNAFRKMERSQGMHLGMTDEEIMININGWRASRANTVQLWRDAERAAFEAVAKPGVVTSFSRLRFKVVGNFLLMKLPSGRYLYYCRPEIKEKLMPWTTEDGAPVYKEGVSFQGVNSKTKKWSRQHGYGGLWVENAVQAVSRDMMSEAMLRVDKAGYTPILTVHDEILSETPDYFGSCEEFEGLMTILPDWADGLPVAAEAWEGTRYKK
jgi:DNA polymerase bacteriophage-type